LAAWAATDCRPRRRLGDRGDDALLVGAVRERRRGGRFNSLGDGRSERLGQVVAPHF